MVNIIFKFIFLFYINFQLYFSLLLNNSSSDNHGLFDDNISERVKLYLPEYQNKYSRVNELNDTNFNFSKIKNSKNVLLIPDNIINNYQKVHQKQRVSEIIDNFLYNTPGSYEDKDLIKTNIIYPDEYTFYGTKSNFYYDHNYVWHKYIKENTPILEKSTSVIKYVIKTEPEILTVENQVCSIQRLLLYIKNPDTEVNLLIKNIKSDIYQIKIFPSTRASSKSIKSSNNSYAIPPKGNVEIPVLVLPDYKTTIHGTLYIEFNNKKVLLIPIKIIGKENQYRVNPIYQTDCQVKKFLSIPIKIFNPSQRVMTITKVLHSFEKINIFWPNGSSVVNNANLPSSTMFQIQPKSSKNIIYLKFFSAFPSSEYGLIRLKTDNDIIVIPVLINSILSPIIPYPQFFNFGLCQIASKSRYNFKKLIPLTLSNKGVENIKIGKVYLEYENIFIQFHQNFNGNNIIVAPNEEIKYGYLIFDGNLMQNLESKKRDLVGKLQTGSIYIETNSTDCPLVQVNYSYLPDMGEIEKVVSGDIQILPKNQNKFSFVVNVKYKPPYGLEQMSQYNYRENITIFFEKFVEAKVVNPSTIDKAHDIDITFEINNLETFNFKRLFYIPIRLTYCLYSFIPVQLDNNDINIVYCGNEESSKSLASCMKTFGSSNIFDNLKNESHKIINFKFSLGAICHGVLRQRFLYIINENSSPVNISEIKTENGNITIDIEGFEYLGNEKLPNDLVQIKKGNFNEIIKKNIKIKNKSLKKSTSILLYPNIAVKLSINLYTDIDANFSLRGKNTIIYNNNSKFIIDNNAIVCKGSLEISPDIYRFEPAFPGLIQSTYIYSKNSIEFPLSLYSVTSNDERIIPSLLTYELAPDNKTSIIKIIFDPSKMHLFKTFMNAINLSSILTYKELFLWKEKEKYWNKLSTTGKTEINANVTLTTSMGKKNINIESFLIKPSLVKNDEINFGLVQTGKLVNNYVEIFNPSDKVLMVKLVLAPSDYGEINNNNMFNSKDQSLLKKNEELILLGCSFSGWVGNSMVTRFEYIIVPENINLIELRRGLINKKKLIKLLYEYGSQKVKNYLIHGYNAFCKYEKKYKNDLIVNNNYKNMNVISDLYSGMFEKEINVVHNMTTRNYETESKKENVKEKTTWEKISSFFLKLYVKYYLHVSLNTEIEIEEDNQPFYLPKSVYSQVYQIFPHQKSTLGPILFKPMKSGNITSTLFLKNNLTILYPLTLKGIGGGGEPSFFPNYQKDQLANSHIFNKTNYIIQVDEHAYNTELKEKEKITRTITVKNTGNLLMNVKNISIDEYGCETDDMRVLQCDKFILYPGESLDIDIEIKPNINNYITNKNIYFNTDYQTFHLNVIVYIEKNIYIKNNMIKNNVISVTLVLSFLVVFFLLVKTIIRFINLDNFKNKKANHKKDDDIKDVDEKETKDEKMKEKIKADINKKDLELKEKNNEEKYEKDKNKDNEENIYNKNPDEKHDKKSSSNTNKNKRKKNNKKNRNNRKISEASNNSNTDTISYDKNTEKEEKEEKEEKKEEKDDEKEEIKEEEKEEKKDKDLGSKDRDKDKDKDKESNSNKDNNNNLDSKNQKNKSNSKSPLLKVKKPKRKSFVKPFGMEDNSDKNKNDKQVQKKTISSNIEKSNATDSTNDEKNVNANNNASNPNSINKYSSKRKFSNNYTSNSGTGVKDKYKYKQTYSKKNAYNYNSNPDEKKQVTTIKLARNISSLNELLNMKSEKDKKDNNKKEEKNNTNKNKEKKEEMKPIFLKDEKRNNAFNLEQELYKSIKREGINSNNNNEVNNSSKIEIDTSNSILNYEGLFSKNDPMNISRININKDDSVSNEDIKEGEEIKKYFNKSLIDNIENPFSIEDKEQLESMYNNIDKSRFFNYDFFNEENNDDKF